MDNTEHEVLAGSRTQRSLMDATMCCQVLLADRSAASRQVLGNCLERCDCSVITAATAHEAWELFQAHDDCRVAVVDSLMVDKAGSSLIRNLRQTRRGRYVYIIATTHRGDRASLRAVMADGADDVLVKPFFHEVLAQRIQVAERLIRMEDRLFDRQRELEHANACLETLHERTRRELTAAVAVQRSLLPGRLDMVTGAQVAWRYIPSTELGGDLIGCFPLGARHLAFYVLDVSGHGVSAALLAVQVCRFLDPAGDGPGILLAAAGEPREPAAVLRALNDRFPLSTNRQYFTIIYGVLDLDDGRLRWGCAGHPWPIACADGRAWVLEVPGTTAIGWLPTGNTVYRDHALCLRPGERLVLYSDGVTEAMGSQMAMFGVPRLVEEVRRTVQLPLEPAVDQLVAIIDDWTAGGPERDDLSLLVLEYTGH